MGEREDLGDEKSYSKEKEGEGKRERSRVKDRRGEEREIEVLHLPCFSSFYHLFYLGSG